MIFVTGAGGTVGRELVEQLAAANVPFRAGYFTNRKVEAARKRGLDAVSIDFAHPDTLRTALQGCRTMFLLGPNVPNQTELELNAVAAANSAGVGQIVKQSVMGAEEEAFSLARVHRSVEKAIETSGMDWTFLRPNSFMQNVVTFMSATIKAEDAFFSASGGAKISHVDVRDIASVAVKVMTERGHAGNAYTLTGPQALSYDEVASELSENLGRPIRHINLSPEDLRQGMLADGMPETLAERMLDLERFFREDRASRVTTAIKRLTGRAPWSFGQYLRDSPMAMHALMPAVAEVGDFSRHASDGKAGSLGQQRNNHQMKGLGMDRRQFMSLCSAATEGNNTFVRHPVTNEEGLVEACSLGTDHFVVKTATGRTRVWDRRECIDQEPPG